MSKSYLYLAGGIVALLIIAGGYLLLSKSNNLSSKSSSTQATNENSIPITFENADDSLSQTDADLEAQLDQADEDIKTAQQVSTSTTSQEDLGSISNL